MTPQSKRPLFSHSPLSNLAVDIPSDGSATLLRKLQRETHADSFLQGAAVPKIDDWESDSGNHLGPFMAFLLHTVFTLVALRWTHFSLRSCFRSTACHCSLEGSYLNSCNPLSGQCLCLPGVVGQQCDHCASGLRFPQCSSNHFNTHYWN